MTRRWSALERRRRGAAGGPRPLHCFENPPTARLSAGHERAFQGRQPPIPPAHLSRRLRLRNALSSTSAGSWAMATAVSDGLGAAAAAWGVRGGMAAGPCPPCASL